jgi:hypothetical protein
MPSLLEVCQFVNELQRLAYWCDGRNGALYQAAI